MIKTERDTRLLPVLNAAYDNGRQALAHTRVGGGKWKIQLMWKIPKKYGHFAFGTIQAGVTCAVASAIASLQFIAAGTFLSHWLRSYLFSWVAMLPIVIVAAPFIRRLADRITR